MRFAAGAAPAVAPALPAMEADAGLDTLGLGLAFGAALATAATGVGVLARADEALLVWVLVL